MQAHACPCKTVLEYCDYPFTHYSEVHDRLHVHISISVALPLFKLVHLELTTQVSELWFHFDSENPILFPEQEHYHLQLHLLHLLCHFQFTVNILLNTLISISVFPTTKTL